MRRKPYGAMLVYMTTLRFLLCSLLLVFAKPVCAQMPSPEGMKLPLARKNWTVMVFMNSRNELDKSFKADFDELLGGGSTDAMNVVAETGRLGNPVTRGYVWQKAFQPISQSRTADMGNYLELADFVSWAKKNFPAKKYLLIVWGHGSGWLDLYGGQRTVNRGVSYDYQSQNFIKTSQLKKVFEAAGPVDVLLFNACRMQSVEVLYELRDGTRYIVGSQFDVQADTFDLTRVLEITGTSSTAEGVARDIVSTAVNLNGGERVSVSAVDSNALKALPKYLDAVAELIEAGIYPVQQIYALTPRFDGTRQPSTVDLHALASVMASFPQPERAASLRAFVAGPLVRQQFPTGSGLALHGVSIELPYPNQYNAPGYKANYDTLELGKASRWGGFLQKIGSAK